MGARARRGEGVVSAAEYSETGSKKRGRPRGGRSKRDLELIEVQAVHSRPDPLHGPQGHAAGETRGLERRATWDNPSDFTHDFVNSYRRDNWNQQPHRVEVWSEKGTVRGVLKPVLDRYAVGFSALHGFNSATEVYKISQDQDGRPLVALYVGDYDPSGLNMSESDLPKRLEEYGGEHIELRRIALTGEQVGALPSFPVADKHKETLAKYEHDGSAECNSLASIAHPPTGEAVADKNGLD